MFVSIYESHHHYSNPQHFQFVFSFCLGTVRLIRLVQNIHNIDFSLSSVIFLVSPSPSSLCVPEDPLRARDRSRSPRRDRSRSPRRNCRWCVARRGRSFLILSITCTGWSLISWSPRPPQPQPAISRCHPRLSMWCPVPPTKSVPVCTWWGRVLASRHAFATAHRRR